MRDNVRQCLKENSEKNYDKVRLEMLSMMSIEERATKYALKVLPYEPYFTANKEAYIEIATEQKAIDEADLQTAKQTYFDAGYEKGVSKTIDKACEWLRNNLGYYDRHEVHIGKSYEEVVIDDFRKALEE